jgi:hypothetical protein
MHMCLIILRSVACLAVLRVSTLSHKQRNFQEKVLKTQNVCFDILCDFFFCKISYSEINLDTTINMYGSSCKVLITHVRL